MVRYVIAAIVFMVAVLTTSVTHGQQVVGSITGSFDVSLSGSAAYTIPIRIAPGTAGLEPKIYLAYDSQAPGGPLGAGWSIAGISVITRGPKNARFDTVPDGIEMREEDALYLDGQRLIAVHVNGSGADRTIEYRKQVDDQTRILEVGADFGSAKFTVNTKGGLRIEFESISGTAPDQNRGNVELNDGSVLLRAETRVYDSSDNYIDFYYLTNGNGNYDVKKICYTGHLATDRSPEQEPYAQVVFEYDHAPRNQQIFVAGRPLIIDTQLKAIISQINLKPQDAANPNWRQVARYKFDFDNRETANRFVLTSVHQFGEDNTELTPTKFTYVAPKTGWVSATRKYALPAPLAKHEELAAGYRFAHVSTATDKLPDLLYATQTDGQVESFAFENKGGSWVQMERMKPPVAFASSDGSDLGVIVADVNGDGRADLLQSYQVQGQPAVTNAFIAANNGWKRDVSYELPFLVSKDGKRTALYQMAYWTDGAGPDLLYQTEGKSGFLINTGNGWRSDDSHAPPSDMSTTWTVDVDCSGKPSLVAAVKNPSGRLDWKVFRFGDRKWEEVTEDSFKFPFDADIDSRAIRIISIEGSRCPGIVVATAQGNGFHALFQASREGWKELPSMKPPFDLVDAAGNSADAVVATVAGRKSSDVFANRVLPTGTVIKFMYFQSAAGWTKAPDNYYIPTLRNGTSDQETYVSIADLTGDGRADIAFPSNSRQHFGRVFVASDDGFKEQINNIPPVAFARQDHQDLGVRLLDLNGDGLPDLLISRSGDSANVAAWTNTGAGWSPAPGLKPSVPFAGSDVAGDPVQFVDVDGDGFLDLLYAYRDKNGTTTTHLYRNVADGKRSRKWSDAATDGSNLVGLVPPSAYPFAADKVGDLGVRFADLAGIGRPYMLVGFQPATGPATLAAFSNDGVKWIPAPEWAPPIPFSAQVGSPTDPSRDLAVQIVDVNGDGLPDIVAKYHSPIDPTQIIQGVWLNTGHGWKKDPSIVVPVALDLLTFDTQNGYQWEKNTTIQWADVNGDGLMDIIYLRREGNTNKSVTYLGTGRGWSEAADWQVPIAALPDRGGDTGLRIVDVNGDGFPDLLYIRQKSDGTTEKGLYINSGAGWLEKNNSAPDIPFVDKDGNDLGVRLYDIDGRGLVDIVQSYLGDLQESDIEINQVQRSDVIRTIDSGYGLRTDIFYQSLMQSQADDLGTNELPVKPNLNWRHVYEPQLEKIQYPIVAPVPATYVVRRVVVNESKDSKMAFSYRYGGLRMDALGKRNLGFAWRESINEINGVLTDTSQTQEVLNPGRVSTEQSCWLAASDRNRSLLPSAKVCSFFGKKGFDWVKLLSSSAYVWKVEQGGLGGEPSTPEAIRQISLTKSTSSSYELDGRLVESHSDEFEYDEPKTLISRRMNTVRTTTTWGDGSKIETVNRYDADDEAKWFFGRLTQSKVTKTASPNLEAQKTAPPQTKTVGFSYNQRTGLLSAETTNLGTAAEVWTSYKRDVSGNIIEKQVHAVDLPDYRPTVYEYDALHRFVVSVSNSLNQKITQDFSTTTGLPTRITDANGVTSTYQHDGFGRVLDVRTQTGTNSYVTTTTEFKTIEAISESVPISGTTAVYAVRSATTDNISSLPASVQLMDAKGRVVRSINEAFAKEGEHNRVVLRDFVFDEFGQSKAVSSPFEVGEIPTWATVKRDVLGRVIEQVAADGGMLKIQYSGTMKGGLKTTVVDTRTEPAVTKTSITNMRGLPVATIDSSQGRVSFEYDAAGRPTKVTNAIGKSARYFYDNFGNRIGALDPDAGEWHYDYDPLGRLVLQTDSEPAGGRQTAFEYDALDRITRQISPSDVWTWEYDSAPHGVGKVAVVKDDANKYIERYSYDVTGKPVESAVTINGETFTSSQDFDSFGRVIRTNYPDQFAVEYEYDAKGFLWKVVDADTKVPYWTLNSVDNAGRITDANYGNGVEEANSYDKLSGRPTSRTAIGHAKEKIVNLTLKYDLAGDLKHREESVQNKSEDFSYDRLDRLTALSRPDGSNEIYSYDANGRIQAKSGLRFIYADEKVSGNSVLSCGPKYVPFDAVSKTVNGKSEQFYTYDCHGNMISDGSNSYSYSSDNRLIKVAFTEQRNWQRSVEFDYRPDGSRYRELAHHGRRKLETISINGYERIVEFGAESKTSIPRFVRHRCYLNNGTGVFAVVEKNNEEFDSIAGFDHPGAAHIGSNPVNTSKTWYLHKDQLGLILAITDETGAQRARYWYDPWGVRASQVFDGQDQPSGSRLEDSWTRGFLGQEHLEDFDLIHLNGRVYNPVLGVFTSPDPLNQSPLDSQLWNPYSYGRNNPLKYVDPSGYLSWDDVNPVRWVVKGAVAVANGVVHFAGEAGKWLGQNWRQVVVVAAVIVVTVVSFGSAAPEAMTLGSAILSGMAAGATAGGLTAALYGGNLSDVLTGAVKGGVIGGLSGAAFFEVGTLTAAGGLVNDVSGVAAHGAVGGLREVAYGGNFWQGFEVGAITKTVDLEIPMSDSFALNTARAALVGGSVASISGGDFANGAVTGAFSYAFNDAVAAHHQQVAIETDGDSSSSGDMFGVGAQVNIGGNIFGWGPKVYNAFGDNPEFGFATPWSDTVVGQGTSYSLSAGAFCDQLCSVGVGASYGNLNLTLSVSARALSFEAAGHLSINGQVLFQRAQTYVAPLYIRLNSSVNQVYQH